MVKHWGSLAEDGNDLSESYDKHIDYDEACFNAPQGTNITTTTPIQLCEDELMGDVRKLPSYDPSRPYVYLGVPPGCYMIPLSNWLVMERHLLFEKDEMEKHKAYVRGKMERKRKQIYLMYEKNLKMNQNAWMEFKKEVEAFGEFEEQSAPHNKSWIRRLSTKEQTLRIRRMEVLNTFAKQLHDFKEYARREMRHAKAKFWPMANAGRLRAGFKGLDDDEGNVEVVLEGIGGKSEGSGGKDTDKEGENDGAKKKEEAKKKEDLAVVDTPTKEPPPPLPMVMLSTSSEFQETPSAPLIIDRTTRIKSKHPATVLVEIHNEGVYWRGISKVQEVAKGENGPELRRKLNKFIPWGHQARAFLFTILCGGLPDEPVAIAALFNPMNRIGGGLLKILLLDLRVSKTTASIQRSAARQRVVRGEVEVIVRDKIEILEKLKEASSESKRIQNDNVLKERTERENLKNLTKSLKRARSEGSGARKLLELDGEVAKMEAKITTLKDEIAQARQEYTERKKAVTKAEQNLKRARKSAESKILAEASKRRTEQLDIEISKKKVRNIEKVLIECIDSRNIPLSANDIEDKFSSLPEGHQIRLCRDFLERIGRKEKKVNVLLKASSSILVREGTKYIRKEMEVGDEVGLDVESKLLLGYYPDRASEQYRHMQSAPSYTNTSREWANYGWLLDFSVPEGGMAGIRRRMMEPERAGLGSRSNRVRMLGQSSVRLLEQPLDLYGQAISMFEPEIRYEEKDWQLLPGDVYGKALKDAEKGEIEGYNFVHKKSRKRKKKVEKVEEGENVRKILKEEDVQVQAEPEPIIGVPEVAEGEYFEDILGFVTGEEDFFDFDL